MCFSCFHCASNSRFSSPMISSSASRFVRVRRPGSMLKPERLTVRARLRHQGLTSRGCARRSSPRSARVSAIFGTATAAGTGRAERRWLDWRGCLQNHSRQRPNATLRHSLCSGVPGPAGSARCHGLQRACAVDELPCLYDERTELAQRLGFADLGGPLSLVWGGQSKRYTHWTPGPQCLALGTTAVESRLLTDDAEQRSVGG